jgi:hypothetical protein
VVKPEEVEDLISHLNSLIFALRRAEMARTGKWRATNPVTGQEVEMDLTPEEKNRLDTELADALRAVREKIDSIDWSSA